MNHTTKRFPRQIEKLDAESANPIHGPYTEMGLSRLRIIYFWIVVIASLVIYALAILYFHVSSAASQAMREESRLRETEKRMQVLCGDNGRVSTDDGITWKCPDKHGRNTITLKE